MDISNNIESLTQELRNDLHDKGTGMAPRLLQSALTKSLEEFDLTPLTTQDLDEMGMRPDTSSIDQEKVAKLAQSINENLRDPSNGFVVDYVATQTIIDGIENTSGFTFVENEQLLRLEEVDMQPYYSPAA